MSKRTALYRHLKHEKPEQTAAALMESHHKALDKFGRVCSLPMKEAKALRLAGAIHHG